MLKRTILGLLMLFVLVIPVQAGSLQDGDCICRSIADLNLNVRQEPDLSAQVVGTILPGACVAGLGFDSTTSWVQVELASGTVGWSSAQFLNCDLEGVVAPQTATIEPTVAATPTPTPTTDPAAALGESGQVCVKVFTDNNHNGVHDGADGELTLGSFDVDGDPALSQPDEQGCVLLSPGTHQITVTVPSNQAPTIAASWQVGVLAGVVTDLEIGLTEQTGVPVTTPVGDVETPGQEAATPIFERVTSFFRELRERLPSFTESSIDTETDTTDTSPSLNRIIVIAAVLLCVVGVLGLLIGLFVISRRRRRAAQLA